MFVFLSRPFLSSAYFSTVVHTEEKVREEREKQSQRHRETHTHRLSDTNVFFLPGFVI